MSDDTDLPVPPIEEPPPSPEQRLAKLEAEVNLLKKNVRDLFALANLRELT